MAFDLSTVTLFGTYTETENNDYRGVAFKSDGTKMYVITNSAGKTVYQYTLSTPWDVTTASYDSVSFNTSGQVGDPRNIQFNSAGTRMFIGNRSTAAIFQYNLSSAWDVSSASYSSNSLSLTGQMSDNRGFCFNSDGTKLYAFNNASVIYQYAGTAYDFSSYSYNSKSKDVSAQDGNDQGISTNATDTKFYVGGRNTGKVYQYSMTGGDISTGSYDSVSLDVSAYAGGEPISNVWKPDGGSFYLGAFGNGGPTVQYNSPASTSIKTIDAVAKASAKVVNGVAIASVKTVDGVS